MALPTEIVDYILGFLKPDLISLKTCTQTHPSGMISDLAERHLYSSITIIYDNGIVSDSTSEICFRARDLSEILCKNPRIANYVRNLKINYLEERHPNPSNLEKISLILPLFSLLRKLTINQARDYYDIAIGAWRTMNPAVPTTVCNYLLDPLRFPSMPDVRIENFSLDSSLLHHCQSFKSLTFSQCSFRPDTSTLDPGIFYPPPLVKSLSIERCDGVSLHNIVSWVRTLPLRSLRLFGLGDYACSSDDFDSLLSQLFSSSLNDLDVNFECIFHANYEFTMNKRIDSPEIFPFVSPSLPSIERLFFRTKIKLVQNQIPRTEHPCEGGYHWTLHAPIPAMLQMVKLSPSLTHLFLDFQYSIWRCGINNPLPRADDIWFPLLSLATEWLSPSIKIYVFVRGEVHCSGRCTFPLDLIHTSIADCPRLVEFVEKGVIVFKERILTTCL